MYEKAIKMVPKPRKMTTQLIQLTAIRKFTCLISTKESNIIFEAIYLLGLALAENRLASAEKKGEG